jgi:hypothetical protein
MSSMKLISLAVVAGLVVTFSGLNAHEPPQSGPLRKSRLPL